MTDVRRVLLYARHVDHDPRSNVAPAGVWPPDHPDGANVWRANPQHGGRLVGLLVDADADELRPRVADLVVGVEHPLHNAPSPPSWRFVDEALAVERLPVMPGIQIAITFDRVVPRSSLIAFVLELFA